MLIESRGVVLVVTQLLGGITAAAIIEALTPGPLSVANSLGRKCPILKYKFYYADVVSKANVSVAQALFMEMFLTAELILAIFMVSIKLPSWDILL